LPNDWEVRWTATAAMDGDGSDGRRWQRWTAMAAMDGDGSNGTTSVSAAAGNLE